MNLQDKIEIIKEIMADGGLITARHYEDASVLKVVEHATYRPMNVSQVAKIFSGKGFSVESESIGTGVCPTLFDTVKLRSGNDYLVVTGFLNTKSIYVKVIG